MESLLETSYKDIKTIEGYYLYIYKYSVPFFSLGLCAFRNMVSVTHSASLGSFYRLNHWSKTAVIGSLAYYYLWCPSKIQQLQFFHSHNVCSRESLDGLYGWKRVKEEWFLVIWRSLHRQIWELTILFDTRGITFGWYLSLLFLLFHILCLLFHINLRDLLRIE